MAKRIQLSQVNVNDILISKPRNTITINNKVIELPWFCSITSKQVDNKAFEFMLVGKRVISPPKYYEKNGQVMNDKSMPLALSITEEEYEKIMEIEKKILTEVHGKYLDKIGNPALDNCDYETFLKFGTNRLIKRSYRKDSETGELTNELYSPIFNVKIKANYNNTKQFNPKFFDGKNANALLEITADNIATEIPAGTVCSVVVRMNKVSFNQQKSTITRDLFSASLNRPDVNAAFEPPPACDDNVASVVRKRPVDEDENEFDMVESSVESTETTDEKPEIAYDPNENSDEESTVGSESTEQSTETKKDKKKNKKNKKRGKEPDSDYEGNGDFE